MALKPDAKRRTRSKKREPGAPLKIEGESLVATAGAMSRSGQTVRAGGVYFLPIDEIVIRKGWQTYRDMRNDDQVKAVLGFKKILIFGRTWEIQPADESALAKEIAKFAEFNLGRVNFKNILKQALSALDFGFSIGEKLWEPGMYEGSRAILLKDIKHRDPSSFEIKQDMHGNVQGFQQNANSQLITVEADDVWHYAHNSEFGNAYGMSDLRAAYRSWWAKKFIINFWSVFMERMGQPMTTMKYPHGASTDLKNTLKQILSTLSASTEVLIPEGVEIELVEATRGGNAGYEEALKYHDVAIARALLMVGLLGLSSDNGGRHADSQSRLHLRVLFKMADEIAQDLMYAFMNQVMKPLVDMNFVHENLYPEFIWQDYGSFEGVEIADTIRQLHAAGIIDMDQADVNYTRAVVGLPLRNEDDDPDEVRRPEATPLTGGGAAQPPKPGQNNTRAEKKGPRKTDKGTGQEK